MIKVVIEGFYKRKLLFGIAIVGLLLVMCVAVDYADNIDYVVNNSDTSTIEIHNNVSVIGVNETDSNLVLKSGDKIHTIQAQKPSLPLITMTGKPSCGCNYGYYWHTRTYINYCPNCHHYNCLGNKHKYNARFEQEISCYNCDSDFCICCGKEKYSWSNVYLRSA